MSARKVEVNIIIKTNPVKIIQAFTEFGMLKDWWDVDRSYIDKRLGGTYTLIWGISDEGLKYVSTGIIDEYNPEQILKIKNLSYISTERPVLGGMTLEIRVEEQPNENAKVYLCQDGYQNGKHWDWYYDAVSQAWPQMLNLLKDYLEK
ncbi:SRPBCC family protein [Winogradskyella sp.]|uniref:SRPBCC family protein n=1 Tax=Winogradskyella sp. TaxID=1883156 RepID=UPI003BAAF58B